MEIIEPKAELWIQKDPYEHVARCASVCYQSKLKEGENAEKFYNGLVNSGHISMLRHQSCYYVIEDVTDTEVFGMLKPYVECPYINIILDDVTYVSTNANFLLDNKFLADWLKDYQVTPNEFKEKCPELMRYTICVTTQISTARELNRTSPNNIAERSTRYIKFGGKVEPSICRPWWLSDDAIQKYNQRSSPDKYENMSECDYLYHCDRSFLVYDNLITEGLKAEDARGVLPLDTTTVVVYTYSIEEWKAILALRLYGTTGKPHPNARVAAELIKEQLEKETQCNL